MPFHSKPQRVGMRCAFPPEIERSPAKVEVTRSNRLGAPLFLEEVGNLGVSSA